MQPDSSAFASLFRAEYAGLVRVSERLSGDRALGEDIVQAVFLRFYERDDLTRVDSPGAYLRRSVVTRTINAIRDRRRLDLPGEEALWSAAEQSLPAEAADLSDLNERLARAIDRLPERAQLILRLSRFEGLTHKEIASQLEIAPKTVENQLARALMLLRKHLIVALAAFSLLNSLHL